MIISYLRSTTSKGKEENRAGKSKGEGEGTGDEMVGEANGGKELERERREGEGR